MNEHLRRLRDELHARAYTFHARGNSEAAQTLWAVVESIDIILTDQQNGDGDAHRHTD